MDNRELIEQIDVLRPGSDDLQQLADDSLRQRLQDDDNAKAIYSRLQDLDRALAAAIREVDSPAGLEDRLIAHLAATPSVPENAASRENVAGLAEASSASVAGGRRRFRRRWVAAVVGLAVAASLVIAVSLPWNPGVAPQNLEELLSQAMDFYRVDDQGVAVAVDDSRVVSDYPVSPSVNAARLVGCRWLKSFLGDAGVAYDFEARGRVRATLYVVRGTRLSLPSTPGLQVHETGGLWASAWQEGSMSYILVVKGEMGVRNASEYFLNLESPPV